MPVIAEANIAVLEVRGIALKAAIMANGGDGLKGSTMGLTLAIVRNVKIITKATKTTCVPALRRAHSAPALAGVCVTVSQAMSARVLG